MKSILFSSLLAVVGCVTLSVVVALIAAPSNLQQAEELVASSPPAASIARLTD